MALITLVKAGNITNLSNARYCAGMGVEIIGFPMIKNSLNEYETSKIKEMANWLSGIQMALEFKDENIETERLLEILSDLNPDFIQLPLSQYKRIKEHIEIPIILTTSSANNLDEIRPQDYYLFTGSLIQDKSLLKTISSSRNLLIRCGKNESNNLLELLEFIQPKGIELIGEEELSPGLKSFDEFSEILDLLEAFE